MATVLKCASPSLESWLLLQAGLECGEANEHGQDGWLKTH